MLKLSSRATKKILGFFFLHEDETLYLNEIVRRLGEDKRNIAKKINEFESMGLLKMEMKGNLKLYSLNKKFPLFKEYKKIILQSAGIENELKRTLSEIEGVKQAFIYGSYAENKMDNLSDIDVMVIGEQNTIELHKVVAIVQKNIDREINVVSMSNEEFCAKQSDPFISKVMAGKKITLI